MVGTILGAAASIGSSVYGAIAGARAARKAKSYLNKKERGNEAWYARRYNEDATQRADAQRMLTQTSDKIKERNQYMAGKQAVMGGTEEAIAADREANNKMYADATSQIAANAAANKDAVEQQYMQNKDAITQQRMGIENAKNAAIGQTVSAAGNVAANVASSLDSNAVKDAAKMTKLAENIEGADPYKEFEKKETATS